METDNRVPSSTLKLAPHPPSADNDEITKMVKSQIFQKSSSQNPTKFEVTNFIKIFFDFAYYTCVCPFRVVKDEEKNAFSLKTWAPQQIVCAIMHAACTVQLISAFRNSIPSETSEFRQNPIPYFNIASTFSSLMYKVVVMKRLWMHKRNYLEALNTIVREKSLSQSNRKIQGFWPIAVLYTIPTLQALFSFVVGTPFVSPIWTWSPSWWFRRLVAFSRNAFWVGDRLQENVAPEMREVSALDYFLALIGAIGMLERHLLSFYCDLSILACSLTLWTTANAFAHEINDPKSAVSQGGSEPEVNLETHSFLATLSSGDKRKPMMMREELHWKAIYTRFQAIRNVSYAINKALGSSVTWLMAENILYDSINLNVVLLTEDAYQRIYLVMNYAITSTLFVVSADICNQLEAIKTWLMKNDNIQTVPYHDANLVLHELISKSIGLRGNNTFTVTFSLVATSLSLVVTFFIICIQYSPS